MKCNVIHTCLLSSGFLIESFLGIRIIWKPDATIALIFKSQISYFHFGKRGQKDMMAFLICLSPTLVRQDQWLHSFCYCGFTLWCPYLFCHHYLWLSRSEFFPGHSVINLRFIAIDLHPANYFKHESIIFSL